jgi:hypothetical protein
MASSNSSLAAKSCACAYIAFLGGIFSWFADGSTHVSAQESIVCIVSEHAITDAGNKTAFGSVGSKLC